MMKVKLIGILFFTSLFFLMCGKEKTDTRSIAAIQKQEGFPVGVQKLTPKPLQKTFYYSGVIKGFKQSEVKAALIVDKIYKVNAKVGDYVQKGAVLIEMDTTNALAKYSQARAAYELMRKTYERVQHVHKVGGVSDQKLDEVRTKYLASKADFVAAKSAIKLTAPISGLVTEVNIKEGEMPMPMVPLVKIAQIDRVYLVIHVSGEDIKYFRKGDRARIQLEKEYEGIVTKISMSASQLSRQFEVEILIPNTGRALQPGMFVEASIITKIKDEALLINQTAVRYDDREKPYLFIVKDGVASLTPVQLGWQAGDEVEIASGVAPGALVAVEGTNLLYDGARVRIVSTLN